MKVEVVGLKLSVSGGMKQPLKVGELMNFNSAAAWVLAWAACWVQELGTQA